MLVSTLVSKQVIFTLIALDFITGGMDTQMVCRSSRSTKGNGGQMSQLQHIERIQTEWSSTSKMSHSSQLEMATTDEPLNPMAPMKPKPRVKTSASMQATAAGGPGRELVCNVCPLMGPSTDINADLLRACRTFCLLTDCPHLHTNQLFKVLAMASMLLAQKSNMHKTLLLQHIQTNDPILPSHLVEGVLLQCLTEDQLSQLLTGDQLSLLLAGDWLPQLLMGDQLLQLLVGDQLPWLLVGGQLPWVSVGDQLPRLLVGDWLPQVLVWDLLADLSCPLTAHLLLQPPVYGKVCLQLFVHTLGYRPLQISLRPLCALSHHRPCLSLIHHNWILILTWRKASYHMITIQDIWSMMMVSPLDTKIFGANSLV